MNGDQLKAWRESRNLTVEQACQIAGVGVKPYEWRQRENMIALPFAIGYHLAVGEARLRKNERRQFAIIAALIRRIDKMKKPRGRPRKSA